MVPPLIAFLGAHFARMRDRRAAIATERSGARSIAPSAAVSPAQMTLSKRRIKMMVRMRLTPPPP